LGTTTLGAAINDNGEATGRYLDSSGNEHGFLYNGGVMTTLPGTGYGINNSGQVVGQAGGHAFLYSGGTMTDLGTLGGSASGANAINNSGQVVGYSYIAGTSGDRHAFLYSGGTMTDLGTLGGRSSSAEGINDMGQVTGQAQDLTKTLKAFLYSGSGMINLGTLGSFSQGIGINNAGQVVGNSYDSTVTISHAFLYSGGALMDLGTLGGSYSIADGIDSKGHVVGQSYTTGDAAYHAFLDACGVMYDLNDLVTSGLSDGVYLTAAVGMSSTGWIVAWGSDKTSYILQPILPPVNQPPTAVCRSETVVAGPTCTASASINNGSFDADCKAFTLSQIPSGPYPLGSTPVTLTATDSGGLTNSCNATVTVVDQTPPSITSLTATPATLWPPNHKYTPVAVLVAGSDNCGSISCQIVSVTSNEPVDPDGDWIITGNLTLNLRADRLGTGIGRVYTVTAQCKDASGNTTSGTTTVTVVHDQGQ
jgi:probable HAF family extracellular repeat protein